MGSRLEALRATGDCTELLEAFSAELALALADQWLRLARFAEEQERIPHGKLDNPDDLDRAIFERLEALGDAGTGQLLEALPSPPPLRTLQRRLQRMVRLGLVDKSGARKDARYRVARGF